MEGFVFFYSFCVDFFYLPCMAFTTDCKLSQFVVSPQTSMSGLFFFSLLALQCHLALITFVLVFSQSSLHASVDHELVSRMKSLELENQTLHKGIFLIVFFFSHLAWEQNNSDFLVSGGGYEGSTAEAGDQSSCAGEDPHTSSCSLC